MANLTVNDHEVVVELTTGEKVGALRGDLHIPRSAVTGAELVDAPLSATRGIRSPGLALPGRIKAGTWRSPRHGREFVAVERGRRAVRLRLQGQKYASVMVSADDPDAVVSALS